MTKYRVPVQAQRARGIKTRNTILEIVSDSDQPLVSTEVHALLAQRGIVRDRTYVLQLLHEMVEEKLVSSRPETPDERMVRTTDSRGMHFTAIYFWAPAGKVPFRTKPTVVKAIRRKPSKKTQTKKVSVARAKAEMTDVTGLMARIENMTNELALLQRVAELEAQLATIRKALN
jgi:hypothetical protein